MSEKPAEPIRVCAVVFRDDHGRVLAVRKKGTSRFMLPGGKPEPGETARETAVREVREEIGMLIHASSLTPLGTFLAPAANEAGRDVEGTIFTCSEAVEPKPAAEIVEVLWVDPHDPGSAGADLAPLLEQKVFPALV
ncbi:NUDIX domain-containing protein [Corynebacterium sp. P3-F1]|uniref:NUDIX hydrolase n=1 Tax=Corynebacterium sp. P3-F1 TaxID=3059080 RepID=UPI00265CAF53|nr:NUDIX domain-containing protein [Corynebacterium sp. P3-F1]WKK62201.1 NUDIX domain-containing protein [Corynebacterium sp. P3-F1]